MNKVIFLFIVSVFTVTFGYSQIDYQVRIDELYSAADDMDGAGNEDPTWKIELEDNDGGGLQPTGCIATTKAYNTWWTGAPSTGPTIPFSWFVRNNCNATLFTTAMECWEEDGDPFVGCDADECAFTDCWGWNSDDGHAPAGGGDGSTGNTGDINFINDAPCTWNQYELTIDGDAVDGATSNYKARISVYWEPNGGTDAGSISGDQIVCENGDPAAFTSVGDGEPANFPTHFTYQWQEDVGCTGTFTDIPSATSATYDPPIGISQTTCFQREVRSANCADIVSNSVTITVNTASTDPSSLTGTPLLFCGAGTVDLTINGGTLGTGASWEWYDGDPNGGGTFLTSTGATASIIGYAITATTNYFVRAEGACGPSNTVNVNVVVSSPNTAPSGVTVTSSTICSGNTTDLTITGGVLGSGATWTWYDTDPTVGTPASLFASSSAFYLGAAPSTTTTYFVRAEGCDTTIAQQTTITVVAGSGDPSSLTGAPLILCGAGTVDLTINGGTLGTGATWEWYDGDPNGASTFLTSTGATASLIGYAITATTNYFVRAEGACGPSNTVNVNVVVSSPNTPPSGVTVTSSTICSGNTTDLTATGGVLGSGATWTWYDANPTIGSPASIFTSSSASYLGATPLTTTTYFVRAEGCDTTTTQQTTITVIAPSVAASGINATQTSFCSGGGSTLSIQGGTLGAGATWEWYEGGCGAGSSIASSTSINVSPTAATAYYVRAEGGCNGNTACVNIAMSIDVPSTDPVSVTSANTDLCLGETTVLNVSGGTLGTGAQWEWYQGSCGGIFIGQGSSISVSPSSSTTYYVRAEGACGNTACANIPISVGVGASDPTAVNVIQNNICPGDIAQIYVTGAALAPDYTWVWYTGSCGAVTAGIGDTLEVTPLATTVYYVRAVGTCGETNCGSVTVTVDPGSIAADGIVASNNNFCEGDSSNLQLIGGSLVSGAAWNWYESACGVTPIGTGSSIMVYPTTTTTYYARAEGGTCGSTVCSNITLYALATNAYLVPFDTICGIEGSIFLNNGIPEGGIYSGPGISNGTLTLNDAGRGTHDITYSYLESNGCNAIASATFTIKESPIVASSSISINDCEEGGVSLLVIPTGGSGLYRYNWSNGENENPLVESLSGLYSVTVTDDNQCSAFIDSLEITDDMRCFDLPNSFTPNGDGMNDMWNLDLTYYSAASIQVYSKWGNQVWEASGTTLNWDGKSNGKDLPSGTYYYILDLDNGNNMQNGPVTIVR